MIMARVEKKDPEAISYLGQQYYFEGLGLQKDMRRAVELLTEAAELGSITALCNLGCAHYTGNGVQENKAMGILFYKKAAMKGQVEIRHKLGCYEGDRGNHDRAVRHFLISAKMGHKYSVEKIKKMFMKGLATKEQYFEALKGYQEAVEEMKSHDRDEARKFRRGEAKKQSDMTA